MPEMADLGVPMKLYWREERKPPQMAHEYHPGCPICWLERLWEGFWGPQ